MKKVKVTTVTNVQYLKDYNATLVPVFYPLEPHTQTSVGTEFLVHDTPITANNGQNYYIIIQVNGAKPASNWPNPSFVHQGDTV
jgi:hypothetical protein